MERRRVCRKICDLLTEEDAPTMIEYALLIALIAVVTVAAVSVMGTNVNELFFIPAGTLGG